MIGGAADLVESTYTEFEGGGVFAPQLGGPQHRLRRPRARRWARPSTASRCTAAACSRSARPSSIFTDYMRPPVRLSALMKLPVVWVWTHDSVAVGEDGPTHQPVETYAALRAIPNLWLIRPGDANETARRGRSRSSAADGPVALVALAPEGADARPLRARARLRARAGRLRAVAADADSPELVLVATGGEVVARARRRAKARRDGHRASASSRCRAGSSSSEQTAEYRDEVLPPDVTARLSVEAGVALGWARVGRRRGDRSRSSTSAPRRPGRRCSPSSASTSTTSSRAPRRCSQRVA